MIDLLLYEKSKRLTFTIDFVLHLYCTQPLLKTSCFGYDLTFSRSIILMTTLLSVKKRARMWRLIFEKDLRRIKFSTVSQQLENNKTVLINFITFSETPRILKITEHTESTPKHLAQIELFKLNYLDWLVWKYFDLMICTWQILN